MIKSQLTFAPAEQYRVLRLQATEPAFTGKYDHEYPEQGVYECAGCGTPLYRAKHKFNSGCGWPAYWDNIPGAVVRRKEGVLTEALCKNCGGHLGHIFQGEGYETPTDMRHCVNSASLSFQEAPEDRGNKEPTT